MLLPENIERKNNKVYEEVNIPPSDPAPTHVGQDRVRIDHLDDVSRGKMRVNFYWTAFFLCLFTNYIWIKVTCWFDLTFNMSTVQFRNYCLLIVYSIIKSCSHTFKVDTTLHSNIL